MNLAQIWLIYKQSKAGNWSQRWPEGFFSISYYTEL